MSYSQLSACGRDRFYQLRMMTHLSMRQIAVELGRNQSTLSREVARNKSEGGLYLPDRAQQQMRERRRQSKQKYSSQSEESIAEIKARLRQYHSPEQIAGGLKQEGRASVSHETIYQMIYADHQGLKGYASVFTARTKETT